MLNIFKKSKKQRNYFSQFAWLCNHLYMLFVDFWLYSSPSCFRVMVLLI